MTDMPSIFDGNQRFGLAEEVLLQRFDQKALLVDLNSEKVYQLNGSAARVVELAEEGRSWEEMVDVLEREYSASKGQVAGNVMDLVRELLEEKLIVIKTLDE